MATIAGRRLYSSHNAGRGHLPTRSGRDRPRGYSKRIPSVMFDTGLSGTLWSGSGVTESTGAIVDPDGVTRTRVRFTAVSAATAFMTWDAGATFKVPKWAQGIELDIWAATPGFGSITSNGLSVDIRIQNVAATQVLNCSVQKLVPGWNRVLVPKEAFATTAGTITFGDDTDVQRVLVRAASVTGHNHDFYIGGLSWGGRSRAQIVIGFDDNMLGAFENGYPLLAARGIPATMWSNSDFLAGGTLDGVPRMTEAQLRSTGWEVHNHGRDHASGYGAGLEADALAQIEDGYTDNGTLMNGPHIFASPFGDFSDTYWSAAATADVDGFRGLWHSGLEVAGSSDMYLDQRKTISAFGVANTTTPAQILAVVDGVAAAGGTEIILFHNILPDVDVDVANEYGITNFTTFVDGLVASSRRNNFDLVTMSQAFMRTCM